MATVHFLINAPLHYLWKLFTAAVVKIFQFLNFMLFSIHRDVETVSAQDGSGVTFYFSRA